MFTNAVSARVCVCVSNSVVSRPFCRATRRVEYLFTTFSSLFKKYCVLLDYLAVFHQMKSRGEGYIEIYSYVYFSSHCCISCFKKNTATLDALIFDSTEGMDNENSIIVCFSFVICCLTGNDFITEFDNNKCM